MKYTVKDNFDIASYLGVVNLIQRGFFDDGEYSPAFGKINAMRLFYNICVTESPFDFGHDIETDVDMNSVLEDADFIKAFNDSLKTEDSFTLNFGNAYRDALDIVETKKNSFRQVIEAIRRLLSNLIDNVGDVLSPDNLQKLEAIAKEVSEGNLSSESIAEAFGEKVFKQG